jgi:hypothetical protein
MQEQLIKEELRLGSDSSYSCQDATQTTFEYTDIYNQPEPIPDGFKPITKC